MPRMAGATHSLSLHSHARSGSEGDGASLESGDSLPAEDRDLLLRLQRQALQYFLDNQMPNGLMLDRQHNHGPRRAHGLCSMTATGMGFIGLALASTPPYCLISTKEAATRIGAGLRNVLEQLPHDQGVIPHFVDSATGEILGVDYFSTVETAWLAAGALWAGSFLQDSELESLAVRFYRRINWCCWTGEAESTGREARSAEDSVARSALLRHGKSRDGQFLYHCWDRLNGETAFMYLLAAGADDGQAVSTECWTRMEPCYGTVAGLRFNNADLGLFVFQYGLDLLDLRQWRAPGTVDLLHDARLATLANVRACRESATSFTTYRHYWGLSAGDGPGEPPETDIYRCYSPAGPVDGTAHITATLASVAHDPHAVLENLRQAERAGPPARGRYGFSNINVDRNWIGRDMVGIDAGAAILALDNYLAGNRVRATFHALPCVERGLNRLGFSRTTSKIASGTAIEPVRKAS